MVSVQRINDEAGIDARPDALSASGFATSKRHRSLCFGRQAELDRLRSALAVPGSTIFVRGALGTGKTRLIAEAFADGQRRSVFTANLWSREMHVGLEAWSQIDEQLHSALLEKGVATSETPPLAHVPAFAAHLKRSFQRLANQTDEPIVVVIEAVHLADATTLEILDELLRLDSLATLVATTRPDVPLERSCRPVLDRCMADAQIITLGSLTSSEIAAWAASSGHADSTGTIEARTGGNPLLVHAEVHGHPSPMHRFRKTVDDLIPELSPAEKTVLFAAAIAPEIDRMVIEDLCDVSPATLTSTFENLASVGLLVADGGRQARFGFPHKLQRRAVVEWMGEQELAGLHWSTMQVLQRRHGRAATEVHRIAHHAAHGAAAGDPVVAIGLLLDSAERSRQSWDHATAAKTLALAVGIDRRMRGCSTHRSTILQRLIQVEHEQALSKSEDTARVLASVARLTEDPISTGIAALGMARLPTALAAIVGGDTSVVKTQMRALDLLDLSDPWHGDLRIRLACSLVVNGETRLSLGERYELLEQARPLLAPIETRELRLLVELAESTLQCAPLHDRSTAPAIDVTLPIDLAAALFLRDSLALLRQGKLDELASAMQAPRSHTSLPRPIGWALARMRIAIGKAFHRAEEVGALQAELRQIEAGTALCRIDRQETVGHLAMTKHAAATALLTSRHRVVTFAALGQAAWQAGDTAVCDRVIDALLPFAAEWVVAQDDTVRGTVASVIAQAATVTGATELAQQMHRLPSSIEPTRYESSPIQSHRSASPTPAHQAAPGPTHRLVCGSEAVELPMIRGVELLARLIENPHQAVPSSVLESDDATAAYVGRVQNLRDLDFEIEEARRQNDVGRQALVQQGFDEVLEQLLNVDGQGCERARMRVTKAIRVAINRISQDHAEIADALTQNVETGRLCCYRGNPDWTIRLA